MVRFLQLTCQIETGVSVKLHIDGEQRSKHINMEARHGETQHCLYHLPARPGISISCCDTASVGRADGLRGSSVPLGWR